MVFLCGAKTGAGHYSYDIHGNVKTLIQETPSLATVSPSQRYKKIDYSYDLISGNVNTVKYQDGQVDAFSHHYEYDADNRLTNVYTSKYPNARWTGIQSDPIWDQDQKLFYYLHGSLARVELGDEKVQGIDYAYTINGWQKGCNSNNLNPHNDMGQDGETNINNLNKNIARDAYGYSLNYFSGDYQAIDPNKNLTANSFTANIAAAAYLSTDAPGLFNGNISSMVTSLTDIAPGSPTLGQAIPQLSAFKYDQLNRVKQMKAYRDINLSTNTWGNGSTYDGSYETKLSYDANGNILTMQRNGVAGVNVNMDNLNYIYETTANGYAKNTNKLRHVNDNTSYTNNYQTDIDDQGTFSTGNENYDYDEVGQQKQDKSEGIATQEWNVYGKVKSITRYNGSTKPDLEFHYNTSGQRISKIVKPRDVNGQRPMIEWITTHYVKDARGNTLAVYEQSNDPQAQTASFKLKERYMYGSNRLGADKTEVEMIGAPPLGNTFSRTLGNKTFDLTNSRGDVITSVTDRKIPVEDAQNGGTIAYWKPAIITTSETYLFGQPMPGRNVGLNNDRHGYQGHEKVDEITGKAGTHYTAEYWELNTLTGRRENNDQVVKSHESPYAVFGNNPILYADPDGKDNIIYVVLSQTAQSQLGIVKTDAIIREAQMNIDRIMGEGKVKVQLFSSENFDIANIDKSDAEVFIGTVSEIHTNANTIFGEGNGIDTYGGNAAGNPERTIDNLISLDVENVGSTASALNATSIEVLGYMIPHGAGHTATGTSGHTDDGEFSTETYENIMSSGGHTKAVIDKGKKLSDFSKTEDNKNLKDDYSKKYNATKPKDNYNKNKEAKDARNSYNPSKSKK